MYHIYIYIWNSSTIWMEEYSVWGMQPRQPQQSQRSLREIIEPDKVPTSRMKYKRIISHKPADYVWTLLFFSTTRYWSLLFLRSQFSPAIIKFQYFSVIQFFLTIEWERTTYVSYMRTRTTFVVRFWSSPLPRHCRRLLHGV